MLPTVERPRCEEKGCTREATVAIEIPALRVYGQVHPAQWYLECDEHLSNFYGSTRVIDLQGG